VPSAVEQPRVVGDASSRLNLVCKAAGTPTPRLPLPKTVSASIALSDKRFERTTSLARSHLHFPIDATCAMECVLSNAKAER
jgi:hypothetical protein